MTLAPLAPRGRQLAIESDPYAAYLAALAPGSRATMVSSLRAVLAGCVGYHGVAGAFEWGRLRYVHLSAIREWLAERYAPATANRVLCALRGVLRECWRLGLMTHEHYQHAIDVPRVRGSRAAAATGRQLTAAELRALVEACDLTTLRGARDGAILALLAAAGLRRAEAVSLTWGALRDGVLRVEGKGRKERTVPMPSSALSVLENWRAELEAAAEVAAESAPMLAPIAGRLRVRAGHHLSSSQIRNVIRTISGRAGVAAPAPHDFRRTYTSGLLAAGVDVFTVSKLLGHASADTTRGYDLRDERAKRDAADLVFFPATL